LLLRNKQTLSEPETKWAIEDRNKALYTVSEGAILKISRKIKIIFFLNSDLK